MSSSHAIIDDIQKVRSANINEYRSTPVMTKYEFNQLISLRVTHLANGAIPFVQMPEEMKVTSNMELRRIALQELREGKLPYLVKRTMPNNKIEYWKIKEMDLTAIRTLLRD
ncbi:MAG: hypothetical protein ACO22Y_06205 [Sediminibacterium sp.]|jgi:DNA-directed RNA polymerase subunit K/omega